MSNHRADGIEWVSYQSHETDYSAWRRWETTPQDRGMTDRLYIGVVMAYVHLRLRNEPSVKSWIEAVQADGTVMQSERQDFPAVQHITMAMHLVAETLATPHEDSPF